MMFKLQDGDLRPYQKGKKGKFKDKYIYDTRIKGYGCGGHIYGDDFSNSERQAVIEYLKSL